jgi:hypothetical protein
MVRDLSGRDVTCSREKRLSRASVVVHELLGPEPTLAVALEVDIPLSLGCLNVDFRDSLSNLVFVAHLRNVVTQGGGLLCVPGHAARAIPSGAQTDATHQHDRPPTGATAGTRKISEPRHVCWRVRVPLASRARERSTGQEQP